MTASFSFLSPKEGFRVVNLVTLMRPFADAELLYYRDDHHWNERGNAVAARLIQEALFVPPALPGDPRSPE